MMTLASHPKQLAMLFAQLVSEVEKQLGRPICWEVKKSGQWGLYDTGGRTKRGREKNRAFVRPRASCSGKNPLAKCALPNLLVAVDKKRANNAGIHTFDAQRSRGNRGRPEAYWCIPLGDQSKLNKVAKNLSAIYRGSLKGLRPFSTISPPLL